MTDRTSPMQTYAALALAVSGALHVIAPLVAGFAPEAARLAPVGVVYLLLAYGLWRGWRWLAYVMFAVTLIGANIAYGLMGAGGALDAVLAGVLVADLACAGLLFLALWRTWRAA